MEQCWPAVLEVLFDPGWMTPAEVVEHPPAQFLHTSQSGE
jgi:hypothetical protein